MLAPCFASLHDHSRLMPVLHKRSESYPSHVQASNRAIISVSLRPLAMSSAVLLSLLLPSLTDAAENLPESLSNFTASSCPFSAMTCNAVRPAWREDAPAEATSVTRISLRAPFTQLALFKHLPWSQIKGQGSFVKEVRLWFAAQTDAIRGGGFQNGVPQRSRIGRIAT